MLLIGKVDEMRTEMNARFDRVDDSLRSLSEQVRSYQSLVERQINTAATAEEVERIISAFVEEYIVQLKQDKLSSASEKEYEQEKQKLIVSLGENAWKKMHDESKTFLITAKVMFNHLEKIGDITDYSGVCILVSKALELEMTQRFYTDFKSFLWNKHKDNYTKYHTTIAPDGKLIKDEKFSMGSLAYVFCYYKSKQEDSAKQENNQALILEYTKSRLMCKSSKKDIQNKLSEFAEEIEEVRNKFRNPSAHIDELRQIDAEKCFEYVIDTQHILKNILESLDY